MSVKIVATCTGPTHQAALSNFTRTVLGQGGSLGGSRSMEVAGTVSIAGVIFLDESKGAGAIADLQWALQSNMTGFVVSIRNAPLVEQVPKVFGRVKISGANRMGILADLADYADSRSIQMSVMRTETDPSRFGPDGIEGTDDDEDPLYNATATLASMKPNLDVEWVEKELYEFGERADLFVDFEKLNVE